MCRNCKHWTPIHPQYGTCPNQKVDFVPYSVPSDGSLKKRGYSKKEREQEIRKVQIENLFWQTRKTLLTSFDYVCGEFERG